jgi:S1-C subfamily serine protease
VDEVVAGSPAEKAGLTKGDTIVAFAGKVTPDMAALQAAVRSVAPGKTTTVTVDRARVVDATIVRERVDVKVKIAPRPESGK